LEQLLISIRVASVTAPTGSSVRDFNGYIG
jgi:hypothetical protein